jgi:hypothetical protein
VFLRRIKQRFDIGDENWNCGEAVGEPLGNGSGTDIRIYHTKVQIQIMQKRSGERDLKILPSWILSSRSSWLLPSSHDALSFAI